MFWPQKGLLQLQKGTKQIMQDEKHSRINSGGANFQAPNSFVKNGPVSQILCGI